MTLVPVGDKKMHFNFYFNLRPFPSNVGLKYMYCIRTSVFIKKNILLHRPKLCHVLIFIPPTRRQLFKKSPVDLKIKILMNSFMKPSLVFSTYCFPYFK